MAELIEATVDPAKFEYFASGKTGYVTLPDGDRFLVNKNTQPPADDLHDIFTKAAAQGQFVKIKFTLTDQYYIPSIDAALTPPKITSIRQLFNAKAMGWKFARDFGINTLAYMAPLGIGFVRNAITVAERAATEGVYTPLVTATTAEGWLLAGMMGSGILLGTAWTTAGRYVGGTIGVGVDSIINGVRRKPLLETSYLKTPLAAAAGGAVGAIVYYSFMVATGLGTNIGINVSEAPALHQLVQVAAKAAAPAIKIS